MSAFHVNYESRRAEIAAALDAARREGRLADAVGLELAARVLDLHLGELHTSRQLVGA